MTRSFTQARRVGRDRAIILESHNGRQRVRTATITVSMHALHDELIEHLADPALDGHLHDALLLVAHPARAERLPPEQLLVAFRKVWDGDLPIVPQELPSKRDEIRWRLASQLIAGYYANSGDLIEAS